MSRERTVLLAGVGVAVAALLVLGGPSTARTPEREVLDRSTVLPGSEGRFDIPISTRAAGARGIGPDTIRFGGIGPDGLAVPGGIWDFEDGTLQGWTSTDVTDISQADPPGDPAIGGPGASYFRRITAADFTGSPVTPLIDGTASLWVGANEEEAAAGCWPGGMGYDNQWLMTATKTFTYGGSGDVTLAFDYFTDSETQFDYTYVYVTVDGVRSLPVNRSAWSTVEGWGYSGAVLEETAIGEPSAPASDTIVLDSTLLPDALGDPFDITFEFTSDYLYSDGLDSYAGFLNSLHGPFGLDDFSIDGVALSDTDDFEAGAEDWVFGRHPGYGAFQQVVALTMLDPVADPCRCAMTVDPENDFVMVNSDWDLSHGPFHHPEDQRETLRSNAAYVGPGSGAEDHGAFHIEWEVWEDTPHANGVGYRAAMDYYPWTCPTTGAVTWTLEPAGAGGFIFSGLAGPRCVRHLLDNSAFMPDEVDSLRIVFELISKCDDFGITDCTGPETTNQSPYWDDLTLTLVEGPLDAPPLELELLYQDAFPSVNSLHPAATAAVHSFFDTNRVDADPTNAQLGDSATVVSRRSEAVYLNFRITPGPMLEDDALDAILVAVGGVPDGPGDAVDDGGFLEVRMCELPGADRGTYATYLFDGSYFDGSQPKILPDGVLTPGTTVEYFFSARDADSPVDTRVAPDTTAGDADPGTSFFLEFDVLPGLRRIAPPGEPLISSTVLYVDAFNAGAQEIIEREGLRPRLGTGVSADGIEYDHWDRYDYLAAGTNLPAPMARELMGDNGMTRYQSLAYRTILYNTGSLTQEGLRNGDADLLSIWLEVARPCDDGLTRGLWLSGDGIATILDRAGRSSANALLSTAGASVVGAPYRETVAPRDSSVCVRLDAAPGSAISGPVAASVRGNGCPTVLNFTILGTSGTGVGDLVYVDQDAGETETPFASVSNDVHPYRIVIDGFSLHTLRVSPPGWTGDGDLRDVPGDGTPCADYAVFQRLDDVFEFLEVPGNPMVIPCEPIAAPPVEPGAGERTRLHAASPNPFNPAVTVRYDLGVTSRVRVDVLGVDGRHVRGLVNEVQSPGAHTLRWDGTDDAGREVAAGVYWARLRAGDGYDRTTRLVLVR